MEMLVGNISKFQLKNCTIDRQKSTKDPEKLPRQMFLVEKRKKNQEQDSKNRSPKKG